MSDGRHCPDHEEPAHAWSHGLGAGLAVVVLVVSIAVALDARDGWRLAAAAVHGLALVGLLTTSAVYHALPRGPWKDTLQVADHAAIYGFIASVHTPFALVVLHGAMAWLLLGAQWGLALLGVVLKVAVGPLRFRTLSLLLYLGMGTMSVPFGGVLVGVMPWAALGLLVLGGVFYLVGLSFYLRFDRPWAHLWWHGLVLAGAATHALLIVVWILPR